MLSLSSKFFCLSYPKSKEFTSIFDDGMDRQPLVISLIFLFPSLFFWPLIQLEGAASDDIALGIAVGSTGRGNLPGATSDIRAALLLLLIGKCTADQEALKEVEGNEFFRYPPFIVHYLGREHLQQITHPSPQY